jgi:hypothetical protein
MDSGQDLGFAGKLKLDRLQTFSQHKRINTWLLPIVFFAWNYYIYIYCIKYIYTDISMTMSQISNICNIWINIIYIYIVVSSMVSRGNYPIVSIISGR